MSSQLLLPCALLLGFALPGFHGQSEFHEGPKLPGDKDYVVDLESLGMSEGVLKPPFKTTHTASGGVYAQSTYELVIEDEKAATLLITPQLQLSKYNLLFKPVLKFNGEEWQYSPLETIQIPVVLNKTIGEFRQTLSLEVLDPKAAGLFQTQRGHKYNINVVQKPDIEQIVRPLDIKVYDQDGEQMQADPPFDPDAVDTRIHFLIPDKAKYLNVALECQPEATSLSYGGHVHPLGTTHGVDLDEPYKSVLVQCQYQNELWTKNSVYDRTYVVTLQRNPSHAGLRSTKIELLVWPPEDGNCGEYHEKGTSTFKCGTKTGSEVDLIAAFNNTKAVLNMVNKNDGVEYRMYNGLPTLIPLGKEYQLELKAGNRTPIYFPVTFEGVAMCNTMTCPARYQSLPNAASRPCRYRKCEVRYDLEFCCEHKRGKCVDVTCPAGVKQRKCASQLQCKWDPCTDEDLEKCCEDKEKPLKYCPKEWVHQFLHPELYHKKFKCNAFQCPEGYEQRLGAENIFCQKEPCDAAVDTDTCCQEEMYCDLMKCPKGYTQRFNAMMFPCASRDCDVAVDRDRCCIEVAYCDTFICPANFMPRPHQNLIGCAGNPCSLGDTSTCCSMMGMCDTFTCPRGTYLKFDAYRTECAGFHRRVCDSPMDEFFCCSKSQPCTGFVCPAGYAVKADAANIFCGGNACDITDNAICCDVVNPFQVGKLSIVPKTGDGECENDVSGEYDFHCKATQESLHMTIALDFDGPVQDGLFIGGEGLSFVPVMGSTALLAIPKLNATSAGRVKGVLLAHVPGRPDVRREIKILVSPEFVRQRRRLGLEDEKPLFWQ